MTSYISIKGSEKVEKESRLKESPVVEDEKENHHVDDGQVISDKDLKVEKDKPKNITEKAATQKEQKSEKTKVKTEKDDGKAVVDQK